MTTQTDAIDDLKWYPAGWNFGQTVDDAGLPVQLDGPDDPDALTYSVCIEIEAAAMRSGKFRKRGQVHESECNESEAIELRAVAANMRLLRNCWRTPAYVWRTVLKIAGLWEGDIVGVAKGAIITDPFFHPLADTAEYATTKLDGHEGRDGFNTELWEGLSLVNGPHSCSSEVAAVTARYGEVAMQDKTGGAAMICPYRGDKWYLKHCAAAPVQIHFGRVSFDPPPGLPRSGPPGCIVVPAWVHRDASNLTRRLFKRGNFRMQVKVNDRRESEVLVMRGTPK